MKTNWANIVLNLQVLPYFRKFEELKGVDIDNGGFIEYPKCYQTVDLDQNECTLLEDLKSRGFSLTNIPMTWVLIMFSYFWALKYHAISFAINVQQPEEFKRLTANLTDI